MTAEPFLCLIILARGVNADLPDAAGSDRLLWKARKWLTVHPEAPQAAAGAVTGIRGSNTVVRTAHRPGS